MKFKIIQRLESTLGSKGFNQILTQDFIFLIDYIEYVILEGFESDRASVPRWLWWLIPPLGKYSIPALIHDWLYRFHKLGDKPCSKEDADTIFLELMIIHNVAKWRRNVMYWAVKHFGSKSWDANTKNA